MTAAAPTLKGDRDISFLENPDLLDIISELSHSIKSESQVSDDGKAFRKIGDIPLGTPRSGYWQAYQAVQKSGDAACGQ